MSHVAPGRSPGLTGAVSVRGCYGTRTRSRAYRPGGWMLFEAILGLTLVVTLAGVVLVASNRQGQTRQRLSDQRAAVRLAEAALTHLQRGEADAPPESGVRVTPMESESAPAGKQWVEVRADYGKASATLVGLVPAGEQP